MPETASPALKKPGLLCGCKALRYTHADAALAQGHYKDDESLYAATLAIKKGDPTARITGREDQTRLEGKGGNTYFLGCCKADFVEAVASQTAPLTTAPRLMIPITVAVTASVPAEPRFPKDSCYSCAKVISGECTPLKPLACG